MSKIIIKAIDSINENRWVKLLGNVISFSPLINFCLSKKNITMTYNDISQLVISIITTLFLLFLWQIVIKLIKLYKRMEDYKGVASLSHYYRTFNIYQNLSNNQNYHDELSKELKYVFEELKKANYPKKSDLKIFETMNDFYRISTYSIEKMVNKTP